MRTGCFAPLPPKNSLSKPRDTQLLGFLEEASFLVSAESRGEGKWPAMTFGVDLRAFFRMINVS